jgi:hypothetical protein
MPSNWGPKVFWLIVFLLAVAGVFAYYYEPRPELGRAGSTSTVENVLSVSPKLVGFELQLGTKEVPGSQWTGQVSVTHGKVVQVHPLRRTGSWSVKDGHFTVTPYRVDREVEPVVVHIVAEVEPNAALTIQVKDQTQTISLAELKPGQTNEYFNGTARLRRTAPVQVYAHESSTDDLSPYVTHDAAGSAHLLYVNCAKSKGPDVESLLSGSFDSLERPITSATLRLSRFAQGSWQYSEPVGEKLESVLDPVAAADRDNRIYVAWSQQGPDGFEIYYTFKEFGGQGDAVFSWSAPVKLTEKPGTHQRLTAITDSKGKVWLAWQTWHHDHFEIYAAVLNDRQHAWAKPGPVAEHAREEEGRWHPALAADGQGNVFVAWSVFRGGHFDLAMVRLSENSVASKPIYLAASERQEQRPALRCDAANNLWVAYEESEGQSEATSFGTAMVSASKIRVRLVRPDLRVEDVPPVPRPLRLRSDMAPVCRHPQLLHTKSGGVLVCFESAHRLFLSRLQGDGWSEPQEFATLPEPGQPPVVTYLDGHVCALFEGADPAGHARLCLTTLGDSTAAAPAVATTPVAPDTLAFRESAEWRRFFEVARFFRKRPEDLVLFKRYLLRGLLLSETAARELGDPFNVTATAFEQGMYDWVLLPKSTGVPPALPWRAGERALAMTQQSERRVVTGYYRPLAGQREPILVVENRQHNAPLPTLGRLQALAARDRQAEGMMGSPAVDEKMLGQFVSQSQGAGFLLTEDWRLLGTMNKPADASVFADASERVIQPFWYPAAEPGRAPFGVRVIAYATGKSYEELVEALRARNFYIATDDIHLLARVDRRMPGEVFQSSFKPKLSVVVQGTGKLAKVEVWVDGKVVHSEEPPGLAAVIEYENKTADHAWHSYVVRVVQADGGMAVTQPFWIRYQP